MSYDNNGTEELYCVYQDGTSGNLYFICTTGNPCKSTDWSAPVQLGFTVPSPNPPGGIAQLAGWAISGVMAML
jgi:hypothetical protein